MWTLIRNVRGIVGLLTVLALVLPQAALAHGGGTPVLTRVEAGPYWLYVFTSPATPQAGNEYHVTVAVTQPQADGSETAIEDAAVTVRFVSAAGETLDESASPSLEGPGYYEADIALPAGGAWTVQVEVTSPLGVGNAEYRVDAQAAASGVAWGWIGAGAILALAGVALLVYAFRTRGAATAQPTDTAGIPEGKA